MCDQNECFPTHPQIITCLVLPEGGSILLYKVAKLCNHALAGNLIFVLK